MKDLHDWRYLQYYPSYHPARSSKIKMAIFSASACQKLANSFPEPSQNPVSSCKHKTKENINKLARPKNEQVVLYFFEENNWPEIEGRKFYAYYPAKGWKLQRGLNISNWKARAKNFVETGFEIKQEATRPISGYLSKLRKNYDEPL